MAEKIFILIYVVCTIYLGMETLITKESFGEAVRMNITLERADIFILLLVVLASYGIMWIFYHYTKSKMITFARFPQLYFNMEKVHSFVLAILIIKLIGTIYFNVGIVNATVSTSFSFVFSIMKIEEFFPIYYVIAREKQKKQYWLNILLYVVLQLLQGWTGFISKVALFEFYFLLKDSVKIRNMIKIIRPTILSVAGVLAGGLVYTCLWPLKQYIRYGGKLGYYILTINEGITKLVERLACFPLVVAAWQNKDSIASLYQQQGIPLAEIKSIFKPLVPAFFMPDKEMLRTLPNLIIVSIYPRVGNNTSSLYNIVLYWITLFKADGIEFCIYILLFVLLFILTSSILHAFDNKENDISILYFLFLQGIVESGSLEMIYSYGYIGAIYMMIIMWAFKVIRVKKQSR